jgi:hypothetical protein
MAGGLGKTLVTFVVRLTVEFTSGSSFFFVGMETEMLVSSTSTSGCFGFWLTVEFTSGSFFFSVGGESHDQADRNNK